MNVELLEKHKTHKRLQAPHFGEYTRDFFRERGAFPTFEVEGREYVIIEHWMSYLLNEDAELDAHIAWTLGNVHAGYARSLPLDRNSMRCFVRLPGCGWRSTHSSFDLRRHASMSRLRAQDVSLPESGSPAWLQANRDLQHIRETFIEAWKKSRKAWLREQRKSGGTARAKEAKKKFDAKELKAAKHAAADQLQVLIDLCMVQKHRVLYDTSPVTVDNVREIFDAQNEMTKRHARLKKALKIQ